MASFLNLDKLNPNSPELKKKLQGIIDQVDFNSRPENFNYIVNRIVDLAYNTDWDFLIDIMKKYPVLATVAVFAAYRYTHVTGMSWLNDYFIPIVRSAESEIIFSDPVICSEFTPTETAPWTFDKIIRAADVQDSFEQFQMDSLECDNAPSVMFNGEEFVAY